MNYGIVLKVLGILLMIESGLMSPSLFISFYDKGTDFLPFLVTIIITLILGLVLSRSKSKDNLISAKDGLAIVALGWLTISILGALPLFLAKATPSYIDAFFEIVSGFTTTGASVIDNVELLPRGILFWRSFSHWIGGMGILVFTIALLPALGIGGFSDL